MNDLKYNLLTLLTIHYGRHIVAGMFKLSAATGVSYRTVQRDVYRQRGQGYIPLCRLKSYADFFGVPIAQIFNQTQKS